MTMEHLSTASADLEYWLALHRIRGFGPVKSLALLELFTHPRQLFESSSAELLQAGLKPSETEKLKSPDWQGVAEDFAWLESHPDHHILTLFDPRYPLLLKELSDPPIVLYVNGDPELLMMPQIALVGSRTATPTGLQIATEFADQLSASGLVITSGLALGIDAAAHQGALQSSGKTMAVLGTGPDRIYPARHLNLAQQIVQSGAIVSEFVPGTSPRKEHFPRRNRVISGLALGTLVVEATIHSGSLITAKFALEQGREVFAIPGSIRNPQVRGCHALIREGAKLVENVDDIIEELGPLYNSIVTDMPEKGGPSSGGTRLESNHILDNLGYDPVSVDELVKRTGLTASDVSSMLLTLELDGRIGSLPGGKYQRLG